MYEVFVEGRLVEAFDREWQASQFVSFYRINGFQASYRLRVTHRN